jgi:hypothetical protein
MPPSPIHSRNCRMIPRELGAWLPPLALLNLALADTAIATGDAK